MRHGVEVAISTTLKDELLITGNSLENVSQSAADIQQICRVRNKDIRKVIILSYKFFLILSIIFSIAIKYHPYTTKILTNIIHSF